jgi:hypothetical protein
MITAAMLSCAFLAVWLTAQEPADPFGEAKAPVRAEPDKKKADAVPQETDPIVLGIRASDPRTPTDVLQAAINLLNYGRVDEAKRYIAALIQARLDDATCWQVQRKFGSATLFRLSGSEDLQPQGRQLTDAILDGSNRYLRDPARLDALVQQLTDAQREVRYAALVDLREAESDAAVAVLRVLADPSRAAEHPTMREALVRIGSPSIGPASAALEAQFPPVRMRAMEVLGRLEASEAVPFLVRPRLTLPPGSPEQVAAEEALRRLAAEPPGQRAAERLLLVQAESFLKGRLPGVPDHQNQIEVWRWDSAGQRPVLSRLPAAAASLTHAVRLAQELAALSPQNPDYRRLLLTASLESAKRTAGWENPLPRGADSVFALALDGRTLWDDVLNYCLKDNHLAAAVGMLEVMAEAGDPTIVMSASAQPRIVVQALRHPDRRVRFAALQAVARQAPTEPFAGASFLPEALGFFVRSTGTRRALIAHPRIELSQTLAGLLRDSGIDAELAITGPQAFQSALKNSDVEFVLLGDSLDRPPIVELVGQFRREPRTAKLPIGVLARPESSPRLRRALADDPLTDVMVHPVDSAAVAFVMRRMDELNGPDAVSHDERLRQSATALDMMVAIAERPERFGFFDLFSQQSAAEFALSVPALSAKASRVLGLFASAQAQQSLVEFASQQGRSLADRQAAVAAFEVAVRHRGVLLESGEILKQYELYNSSANLDPATQQVLGTILDVMEAPPEQPPAVSSGNAAP